MALGNIPRRVIWLSILATLMLAATAMNSPNESMIPRVTAYVGDTTAMPGATNTVISAFIDNNFDTIVGFSLWIQMSGPIDLCLFQVDSGIDIDTLWWRCVNGAPPNCLDSINIHPDSVEPGDFFHVDTFDVLIGSVDTTGTLVAGWEYISTRSFSENGSDLLIVGIANLAGGPITPGFAPQQGGRLIKILADVGDIADTTYWQCLQYSGPDCIDSLNVDPDSAWDFIHVDTSDDRTAFFQLNKDFKDYLNFATSPEQNFWEPIPYWDTNGWICTQWVIDSGVNPPETLGCGAYERSSQPPWDSIDVVLDTTYVLDTSKVHLFNGTLVVQIGPPFLCGDMNGDGTAGNIIDLTFIVDRIFRGGPASNPPEASDINCDGTNGNILDLTTIVDRIFRGGPPLCNGGTCP